LERVNTGGEPDILPATSTCALSAAAAIETKSTTISNAKTPVTVPAAFEHASWQAVHAPAAALTVHAWLLNSMFTVVATSNRMRTLVGEGKVSWSEPGRKE